MSNIEISIWGIRAGFVEAGIFHSKEIQEIRTLQEDIYRPLANNARPHDTFMIHRTRNYTMVSLLFTNRVKEYSASGAGRDGYIVFSFIIPKGFAFASSPRVALQKMAVWYLERQADKKNNNFTGNQLNEFLQNLTLKSADVQEKSGKKFTRIESVESSDTLLCADNSYASFNELILIQNAVDFPVADLPHQKVDLVIEKKKDDEEKEIVAKRQKEQEQINQEVKKVESELNGLLNNNDIKLAIAKFDNFQHRNSIGSSVRTRIDREKETINRTYKDAQVAKEQGVIVERIKSALGRGDDEGALLLSSKLRDKNLLTHAEKDRIRSFERAKDKQEQAKRDEVEALEQKEKKKKLIIYGGIGLVVMLLGISFFMEIPVSFYDADGDGIANSCDLCAETKDGAKVDENGCSDSDGDGIYDNEDNCENTPKGTQVNESGCPDSDGDGVPDDMDRCDSTKVGSPIDIYGCLDSDQDGVADDEDQCDSTKIGTKVDEKGCPIKDVVVPPGKKEQIEKLKKGESVEMPKDAKFALKFKKVRITNGKWMYQKDENGPFVAISSPDSYAYLNEYFSQNLKLTTETVSDPGDPVSPPDVGPTPGPGPDASSLSAAELAKIKAKFSELTAKQGEGKFTADDRRDFMNMTSKHKDDSDVKRMRDTIRRF